mmetsp:Transcript_108444/g.339249  ORF Transcript_108444/g.339249 Transcript_108444/m.339249 type:complete len:100 (+) Transcript_108444:46-345(+)
MTLSTNFDSTGAITSAGGIVEQSDAGHVRKKPGNPMPTVPLLARVDRGTATQGVGDKPDAGHLSKKLESQKPAGSILASSDGSVVAQDARVQVGGWHLR